MKNKIFIYFVFLIISLLITVQTAEAQWVSVEDGGSGDLTKIKFKDENTGWYISDMTNIYKTTNGGLNWRGLDIPNIDSLVNLIGINCVGDTIWINTYINRLIKSTNGGNNWFEITFNNYNSIYNLQYINFELIYAIGSNSNHYPSLIKSTNGGLNWIHVFDFPNLPVTYNDGNFYNFINDTVGFSKGYKCIAKTTNGGYNWNIIYTDTGSSGNVHFDYMKFINDTLGFLVKNLGYLYITTNGGYNWQYLFITSANDLIFENALTGYMIGTYDSFYKTTNGGLNWDLKFNYIPPSYTYRQFIDLDRINNHLYIASRHGGGLFKSTNSGETFRDISKYETEFRLKTIDFTDNLTGFAGGGKSGILQTTNGGINWFENENFKNLTKIFYRDIEKIQFTDLNTGWVLTDTGFYKSTNSGNNWFYFPVINEEICEFYFINNYTGWIFSAIQDSGKIKKTTDSGYNWTLQCTTPINWVTDINFLDSLYGYITFNDYFTGENLYRTTNGGMNWVYFNLGSFYSVCIVDRNNAYLGGDGKGIMKTADGGNNWREVLPLKYLWFDIEFINQKTGFACNYGKNIYYTTNEGENWSYSNIGSTTVLKEIYLRPDGFGIAVGASGKIYRTTNFGGIVGIGNQNQTIPEEYELFQNYPNPFNQFSIINYKCSIGGMVKIALYDLLGRKIVELMNEYKQAGSYSIRFDANGLSSGVYYYVLFADGKRIDAKKMAVIK